MDTKLTVTMKITPKRNVTKTIAEWNDFKSTLKNKIDKARMKEFKTINGWKKPDLVTCDEICKNARKYKNWIDSRELENDNKFCCCNDNFFDTCTTIDVGKSSDSYMKYYLPSTDFFICGKCLDNMDLDELADSIKDSFDDFKDAYID